MPGGSMGGGDGSDDMSPPEDAPQTTDTITAGGGGSDDDDSDDDKDEDNDNDKDNPEIPKDAPATSDALTAKKLECPAGQEVTIFSASCKPAGINNDAPASKTIDIPGGGKITYTYHPNGKMASQTLDLAWGDGVKLSSTWNPDGKKAVETRTDSNGRKTTYTNEPYTVTVEVPGYSKITTTHGPHGKSETMTFPGGKGHIIYHSDHSGAVTHTTSYDSDGHWSIMFPQKPDGTIKTYFENGTNVVIDGSGKELKRWNDE
jgi:hypothetical protein